jgi:hypothetical protein
VAVTGRPAARPPVPWRTRAEDGSFLLVDTAEGGAVRLTVGEDGGISVSRPVRLLREPGGRRRGS